MRVENGAFVGKNVFDKTELGNLAWDQTQSKSLFRNSAGYIVTILLALSIHNLTSKYFKKSVQLITYAPFFISIVVMCGIIIQFLHPRLGIVNKLIMLTGLEPLRFMGDPKFFYHVFVWSGIWQWAGWGTIIYLAALSSINPELHEAAIVDGATRIQRTIHIDIPGILPTAFIILILEIGSIMSVGFEKAFLLQNDLNLRVSEVIQTYAYKVGLAQTLANYSYGAAIGLFNAVVSLLLIVTANAIAKRVGETSLW